MRYSSYKRIFFHDLVNVISSQAGVAILGLVAFFMLIPVTIFAFQDTSIFNIDYTHMQIKFLFCSETSANILPYGAAIYGSVLGHCIGSFLLNKRESGFYLSVGTKRSVLLLTRILAGIIILVFVIAIPMTVSLMLNIAALGSYSGLFSYYGVMTASLLIDSSFFMVLFIMGCCIAGVRSEAIIYSASFALLPTALTGCVNSASELLFYGGTWGKATYLGSAIEESLIAKLDFLNPLFFFSEGAIRYSGYSRTLEEAVPQKADITLLLGWAVALAAITALTVLLLKIRKVENIGISGKTLWADTVSMIVLGTGVFALTAELLDSDNTTAVIWAGIATSVFACVVMEVRFLHTKHDWIRSGIPLAASVICIALPCIVFSQGALGAEAYIPEVNEISSVQVSYVGNPSYMPQAVTGSTTGGTYYTVSTLELTEQESFECITLIHQSLIDEGRPTLEENEETFGKTGIIYDIYIEYDLKNGSVVKRYYDSITLDGLAEFLKIEDVSEVKNKICETVSGIDQDNYFASDAYLNGNIWFADPLYSNVSLVDVSQEQREELLNAIAADIESLSVSELYYPQQEILGVIMFSPDESDTEAFSYNLYNTVICFTESYENTVALIRQWGLYDCFNVYSEVESITFQRFTPYSTVSRLSEPMSMYFMGYKTEDPNQYIVDQDFGKLPEVTDEDTISELLPLLKNGYFMNGGGYLACVKIKDSEEYIYLFLPEELAPEYIKNRF